jgi:exonuclease SbcD
MKVLHTADWHLGDRLGRIPRAEDLRRAVERLASYCEEENVDVLLVAGDLFSDLSRPDVLRASVEHLAKVFEPFLLNNGTILALTGNHDNENFCRTMGEVLRLAAPAAGRSGARVPAGRLYLAAEPTFFRLADREEEDVQFVLMPFPTPSRYLDEPKQRYRNRDEKHHVLRAAYADRLLAIRQNRSFQPELPTILAAHIHVQGAVLPNLFRMAEQDSIIFPDSAIPTDWAYVALGHIHQPQCLRGLPHVRYSGSIDRLDLGERADQKSVVLVDIGPDGRRCDPQFLPLDATPIYEVQITNPRKELPLLPSIYPDADRALVKYHLKFEAGRDNLHEILADLDRIFPRWYDRNWQEAGASANRKTNTAALPPSDSFHATVVNYLRDQLAEHPKRKALMRLADSLLTDESP